MAKDNNNAYIVKLRADVKDLKNDILTELARTVKEAKPIGEKLGDQIGDNMDINTSQLEARLSNVEKMMEELQQKVEELRKVTKTTITEFSSMDRAFKQFTELQVVMETMRQKNEEMYNTLMKTMPLLQQWGATMSVKNMGAGMEGVNESLGRTQQIIHDIEIGAQNGAKVVNGAVDATGRSVQQMGADAQKAREEFERLQKLRETYNPDKKYNGKQGQTELRNEIEEITKLYDAAQKENTRLFEEGIDSGPEYNKTLIDIIENGQKLLSLFDRLDKKDPISKNLFGRIEDVEDDVKNYFEEYKTAISTIPEEVEQIRRVNLKPIRLKVSLEEDEKILETINNKIEKIKENIKPLRIPIDFYDPDEEAKKLEAKRKRLEDKAEVDDEELQKTIDKESYNKTLESLKKKVKRVQDAFDEAKPPLLKDIKDFKSEMNEALKLKFTWSKGPDDIDEIQALFDIAKELAMDEDNRIPLQIDETGFINQIENALKNHEFKIELNGDSSIQATIVGGIPSTDPGVRFRVPSSAATPPFTPSSSNPPKQQGVKDTATEERRNTESVDENSGAVKDNTEAINSVVKAFQDWVARRNKELLSGDPEDLATASAKIQAMNAAVGFNPMTLSAPQLTTAVANILERVDISDILGDKTKTYFTDQKGIKHKIVDEGFLNTIKTAQASMGVSSMSSASADFISDVEEIFRWYESLVRMGNSLVRIDLDRGFIPSISSLSKVANMFAGTAFDQVSPAAKDLETAVTEVATKFGNGGTIQERLKELGLAMASAYNVLNDNNATTQQKQQAQTDFDAAVAARQEIYDYLKPFADAYMKARNEASADIASLVNGFKFKVEIEGEDPKYFNYAQGGKFNTDPYYSRLVAALDSLNGKKIIGYKFAGTINENALRMAYDDTMTRQTAVNNVLEYYSQLDDKFREHVNSFITGAGYTVEEFLDATTSINKKWQIIQESFFTYDDKERMQINPNIGGRYKNVAEKEDAKTTLGSFLHILQDALDEVNAKRKTSRSAQLKMMRQTPKNSATQDIGEEVPTSRRKYQYNNSIKAYRTKKDYDEDQILNAARQKYQDNEEKEKQLKSKLEEYSSSLTQQQDVYQNIVQEVKNSTGILQAQEQLQEQVGKHSGVKQYYDAVQSANDALISEANELTAIIGQAENNIETTRQSLLDKKASAQNALNIRSKLKAGVKAYGYDEYKKMLESRGDYSMAGWSKSDFQFVENKDFEKIATGSISLEDYLKSTTVAEDKAYSDLVKERDENAAKITEAQNKINGNVEKIKTMDRSKDQSAITELTIENSSLREEISILEKRNRNLEYEIKQNRERETGIRYTATSSYNEYMSRRANKTAPIDVGLDDLRLDANMDVDAIINQILQENNAKKEKLQAIENKIERNNKLLDKIQFAYGNESGSALERQLEAEIGELKNKKQTKSVKAKISEKETLLTKLKEVRSSIEDIKNQYQDVDKELKQVTQNKEVAQQTINRLETSGLDYISNPIDNMSESQIKTAVTQEVEIINEDFELAEEKIQEAEDLKRKNEEKIRQLLKYKDASYVLNGSKAAATRAAREYLKKNSQEYNDLLAKLDEDVDGGKITPKQRYEKEKEFVNNFKKNDKSGQFDYTHWEEYVQNLRNANAEQDKIIKGAQAYQQELEAEKAKALAILGISEQELLNQESITRERQTQAQTPIPSPTTTPPSTPPQQSEEPSASSIPPRVERQSQQINQAFISEIDERLNENDVRIAELEAQVNSGSAVKPTATKTTTTATAKDEFTKYALKMNADAVDASVSQRNKAFYATLKQQDGKNLVDFSDKGNIDAIIKKARELRAELDKLGEEGKQGSTEYIKLQRQLSILLDTTRKWVSSTALSDGYEKNKANSKGHANMSVKGWKQFLTDNGAGDLADFVGSKLNVDTDTKFNTALLTDSVKQKVDGYSEQFLQAAVQAYGDAFNSTKESLSKSGKKNFGYINNKAREAGLKAFGEFIKNAQDGFVEGVQEGSKTSRLRELDELLNSVNNGPKDEADKRRIEIAQKVKQQFSDEDIAKLHVIRQRDVDIGKSKDQSWADAPFAYKTTDYETLAFDEQAMTDILEIEKDVIEKINQAFKELNPEAYKALYDVVKEMWDAQLKIKELRQKYGKYYEIVPDDIKKKREARDEEVNRLISVRDSAEKKLQNMLGMSDRDYSASKRVLRQDPRLNTITEGMFDFADQNFRGPQSAEEYAKLFFVDFDLEKFVPFDEILSYIGSMGATELSKAETSPEVEAAKSKLTEEIGNLQEENQQLRILRERYIKGMLSEEDNETLMQFVDDPEVLLGMGQQAHREAASQVDGTGKTKEQIEQETQELFKKILFEMLAATVIGAQEGISEVGEDFDDEVPSPSGNPPTGQEYYGDSDYIGGNAGYVESDNIVIQAGTVVVNGDTVTNSGDGNGPNGGPWALETTLGETNKILTSINERLNNVKIISDNTEESKPKKKEKKVELTTAQAKEKIQEKLQERYKNDKIESVVSATTDNELANTFTYTVTKANKETERLTFGINKLGEAVLLSSTKMVNFNSVANKAYDELNQFKELDKDGGLLKSDVFTGENSTQQAKDTAEKYKEATEALSQAMTSAGENSDFVTQEVADNIKRLSENAIEARKNVENVVKQSEALNKIRENRSNFIGSEQDYRAASSEYAKKNFPGFNSTGSTFDTKSLKLTETLMNAITGETVTLVTNVNKLDGAFETTYSKANKFGNAFKKAFAEINAYGNQETGIKFNYLDNADLNFPTDKVATYKATCEALSAKITELQNKGITTPEDVQEVQRLTEKANGLRTEIENIVKVSEKTTDNGTLIKKFDTDEVNNVKASMEALAEAIPNASLATSNFNSKTNELTFTVKTGKDELTTLTYKFDELTQSVYETGRASKTTTGFFKNLFGDIKGKVAELTRYYAGMSIITQSLQQVRRGVQYVREIDLALTELKKVTDETDATYTKFLQDMSKTASVVGSTTSELTSSAADWARLGLTN